MRKTLMYVRELSVHRFLGLTVLLACFLNMSPLWAEEGAALETAANTAIVSIDGIALFPLRGISAFPAEKRAEEARSRIVEFARDETLSIDDLVIESTEDADLIKSSKGIILRVFDGDAAVDNIERKILSRIYLFDIREAVARFRHDRSPEVLWKNVAYAAIISLISAALLWGLLRLFRWLDARAAHHVQRNLNTLADKAHNLFNAAQVWSLFATLMRLLRVVALVLLIYFLLNTVLGLFPWTRPIAIALFALILEPVKSIAGGFVNAIPDLAFLIILFLLVRYVLKIIRVFFKRVESGHVKLENFDADWAIPTFKILRILVVAFALVIAYPYIPGSDSMAFKGISVFLGVIFSLGSSSFISGMIAGLTMTYRGAFKEGDRVSIGDVVGVVTDIRMMVTRIRTPKNEIVVIPNTSILTTNVVNYSTMARERKLILHTVVGIGYDTPWRQVEAMLLLAASRTEGLLQEPPAFVLQNGLGDFAVNYELNVYCGNDAQMLQLYSKLHAQILDVFNEYGVQIMSPAYEGDPQGAKTVPKEQWFAAPAKQPEQN